MYAVATGLADRYAPANVTPPTGYTNIRGATVETPNNIPAFPYVIVDLPEGELIYDSATRRVATWEFDVYFLYSKASGDLPRDRKAMLKWLSVLIDQLHDPAKLDTANVMKAIVLRANPGSYEYAGALYHSWNFRVQVKTEDTVSLVP